jgi:hypothetical protein
MLDHMFITNYGMLHRDSAYRCRRCGSGPVTVSDGFLMSHCMNCGNWQGDSVPIDLGLGKLKDMVVAFYKWLNAKLFKPSLVTQAEPALANNGGGQ